MKNILSSPNVASIYVHWPYCAKLCNYCNFNKYVNKDEKNVLRIGKCLMLEGSSLIKKAQIEKIDTIYFGGGTPSLMPTKVLSDLIESLKCQTNQDNVSEITLEVNPSKNLSLSQLDEFVDAGIDRFSIGVQAFDDDCLSWMNRDHDVETAQKFLEYISCDLQPRLRSFTIDLMFGRPNQRQKQWTDELRSALQKYPTLPHVSLYELTVERGTPLEKDVRKGRIILPSEETRACLYEDTVEVLKEYGFQRYEISNFSKGEEHRGRHNSRYWQGGNYLGLGPGAHGRYHINGIRHATIQRPSPQQWMKEVEQKGHGTAKREKQTNFDVLTELIATSLRTIWGLESHAWTSLVGQPSLHSLICDNDILASFKEDGQLLVDENGIRLSERGLLMADYITPYVLSSLKRQLY